MTPEPVPFVNARGQRISAYRHGPPSGSAVVLAHGILAHQKIPELAALASRLAEHATVYTLDFRGHGESEGSFTLGREEHLDLAQLLATARASHDRLALVGFSFGGFHSVLAATAVPVDALCLVSAPAHLRVVDHFPFGRAYFQTLPHILRRRRGRIRVNPWRLPTLQPYQVIEKLTCPILVLHGTSDWIVSERHARLLHELARAPCELLIIPGGLHAEYLLTQDLDEMARILMKFTILSHPDKET